jgi:hypothetical protein
MPTERDVVTADGSSKIVDIVHEVPPEMKEGELVAILSRGYISSRLDVPLPDGLYGEWVVDDPEAIAEKRAKGFVDGSSYVKQHRALHNDGTSSAKVGDCVFMICSKSTKETLDRIYRDLYNRTHGKKSQNKKKEQSEDTEFVKNADQRNIGIPAFEDSSSEIIDGEQLAATIRAHKESQTTGVK